MDRAIYPCPPFLFGMKVSIIVPVYNQENLLFQALDTVPQRDDVEVIVVDDGSTDRTWERLQAYMAKTDRNIKAYRNDVNRGVGYARNKAIDHATGDYIYGLDADDYLLPEWESALEQLDADIVYVIGESNDGSLWQVSDYTRDKYGAFWLKFVRRSFIGSTRCNAVRWAEDKDFTLKLLDKNPSERRTNIVAYHYNWPRQGSLCWMENYGVR